jgi:hypothetical protein
LEGDVRWLTAGRARCWVHLRLPAAWMTTVWLLEEVLFGEEALLADGEWELSAALPAREDFV